MKVIVTGAAGFIGSHVAAALLDRGAHVVGVDDLNAYYDPRLKEARLERLRGRNAFAFHRLDIADRAAIGALTDEHKDVTHIVHLAAQAGVRHSLTHPEDYIRTNLVGHFEILETCRRFERLEHLVYASSSSVYGGAVKLPYAESDRVDTPISLYAATKKADELLAYPYAHLYRIPTTGLRFFTVYGPWGRPDMSAYIFTAAILAGRPISVFNHGDMKRDFTFIDDIVDGVVTCVERPPPADGEAAPYRLYNLGNNRPEPLMRFIETIEKACGVKAQVEFEPMQPGDVKETYADIELARHDLNFEPKINIDEGIPRFVAWFRDYHGV